MQLVLQSITEHYCERISAKRLRGRDFARALGITSAVKGCEPRCLLFSFAA
jgi:hypothetical protein